MSIPFMISSPGTPITSSTVLPNGVTASTQTAGSNDTKVATDAYVDAPASGGTPIVNVPFGFGGIFAESIPSASVFGTANTMAAVYFVAPFDMVINNVYFAIGTGVASQFMGVAIYDTSGNKLTAADAQSVASSNTVVKGVLSSSITLKKKTGYWIGWVATTNTTLTCMNVLQGSTNGFQGLFNKNVVRSGNSNGSSSGGTTPTSLGTITSTQLRIPVFYFD